IKDMGEIRSGIQGIRRGAAVAPGGPGVVVVRQVVERMHATLGRLPLDAECVVVAAARAEAAEQVLVGDAVALEEGRLVRVQVAVLPGGDRVVAPLVEGGGGGGRQAWLQPFHPRAVLEGSPAALLFADGVPAGGRVETHGASSWVQGVGGAAWPRAGDLHGP